MKIFLGILVVFSFLAISAPLSANPCEPALKELSTVDQDAFHKVVVDLAEMILSFENTDASNPTSEIYRKQIQIKLNEIKGLTGAVAEEALLSLLNLELENLRKNVLDPVESESAQRVEERQQLVSIGEAMRLEIEEINAAIQVAVANYSSSRELAGKYEKRMEELQRSKMSSSFTGNREQLEEKISALRLLQEEVGPKMHEPFKEAMRLDGVVKKLSTQYEAYKVQILKGTPCRF